MAAANKPTFIHYLSIGLTISFLITLVVAIMFYKQNQEALAKNQADTKKAQEAQTALTRLLEQVTSVKKKIGHEFEEIGAPEDQNATTVLGAMQADIQLAGELAQPTYSATIRKLVDQVRQVTAQRDQLRADLDGEHAKLLALQSEYQTKLDEQTKGRNDAEKNLNDRIRLSDEDRDTKDKEIAEQREALKQLQLELDQEKLTHADDNKKKDKTIDILKGRNETLRRELDEVRKYSFEKPDGHITYVDNTSGLVWLDLGSADRLNTRTSFSVYNRSHSGVARGGEDIKGSIEVTDVLGPHRSVAKITKDDIKNPIGEGDPIYTPLWSPGTVENFSFVGLMDLDGDGRSDRDQLHAVIAAAGAKIDNEIDDAGAWVVGKGITVNTKFLVKGKIPDPTDAVNDDDRRAALEIQKQSEVISEQAAQQGVKIVNLGDFLSYIGYRPQYEIFRPGDQRPYTLRNGARSESVKSTLGSRVSPGHTSGLFKPDNQLGPKTSSGQTSGLFKGPSSGY